MNILKSDGLLKSPCFLLVDENVISIRSIPATLTSTSFSANFEFYNEDTMQCYYPDGSIESGSSFSRSGLETNDIIKFHILSEDWSNIKGVDISGIIFDLEYCMPRGAMSGALFEKLEKGYWEQSGGDASLIDLSNITHLKTNNKIIGTYNFFGKNKLRHVSYGTRSSSSKMDYKNAIDWENLEYFSQFGVYAWLWLGDIPNGITIPVTYIQLPYYTKETFPNDCIMPNLKSFGITATISISGGRTIDFSMFNSTQTPSITTIFINARSCILTGEINIGSIPYVSIHTGIYTDSTTLTGTLTNFAKQGMYYLGLEGSAVNGDLADIEHIDSIGYLTWALASLAKTRVTTYTSITGEFAPKGFCWHTCNTNKHADEANGTEIAASELNRLIANKLAYCVRTGQANGYLNIGGTNPAITDTTTLANINTLINTYNFTVIYNS